MKRHYDAVVFDMDGVLIDAREWHYEALNQALGLFGIEISPDSHQSRFDGLPTREKLAILTAEQFLPLEVHALINSVKQERTLRIASSKCYPQAHHLILMATLKRLGFRLGLATNSVRVTTETMLRQAGLLDFFDVVVTNQDVPLAKPAPDVYLKAFELLGVLPDQVLVVEDNDHGVRAARLAGADVCVVKGPNEVHLENLALYIEGLEG
jgi:HAD superfamily hydrolase (TIGR01509 family)